jgi:dihydropteroate synthase
MHLRGTPQTMQQLPPVRDIVPAVRRGLAASLRRALRAGIRKSRIVLDPGIGFGKTAAQSIEMLNGLRRFASLGYPILIGPSRKSFIRAALVRAATVRERGASAKQRFGPVSEELLCGTAAVVAAAILNGAHIVRVHDVREMLAVVRIADRLLDFS